MPSQLPTTSLSDRMVRDFGIGTYDSPVQSENSENDSPEAKMSLPGFPYPVDEGDEIIGDSYAPKSDLKKLSNVISLPGDYDRKSKQNRKPEDSIIQTPIQTVAESKLPNDSSNPTSHSDYYDKTKIAETELPGVSKNENSLDKFLGSLGNWWSGFSYDDVAQPISFPVSDRPLEEVDKYTSVPMGTACMKNQGKGVMQRQATNLDLVGTLTSEFLKKNGKKGLTRRHVMAFLREEGYHQYLASDIIRCMHQRHGVHVADVLDQFPVLNKKASSDLKQEDVVRRLNGFRQSLASISTKNSVVKFALEKCSNDMEEIVTELMRGLGNG